MWADMSMHRACTVPCSCGRGASTLPGVSSVSPICIFPVCVCRHRRQKVSQPRTPDDSTRTSTAAKTLPLSHSTMPPRDAGSLLLRGHCLNFFLKQISLTEKSILSIKNFLSQTFTSMIFCRYLCNQDILFTNMNKEEQILHCLSFLTSPIYFTIISNT